MITSVTNAVMKQSRTIINQLGNDSSSSSLFPIQVVNPDSFNGIKQQNCIFMTVLNNIYVKKL